MGSGWPHLGRARRAGADPTSDGFAVSELFDQLGEEILRLRGSELTARSHARRIHLRRIRANLPPSQPRVG
jgi:hypothetical protein